ncbi:type II secretion system F family protein [Spirillospora albida]|uniref:type II secretion system F family protein n=1 Tax=Spirillospora albida TaxID=58123 RepID=UPI0004C01C8D|nr:type II secretion system F family protein [Spirillospora albida]
MTTKRFAYAAVDTAGARSSGQVEAADTQTAAQQLRERGLTPLQLRAADSLLQRELSIPGLSGRVSLRDLAVFARQFATMTAAGVPLLRALGVLEDQASRPALKTAIGQVRVDIEAGLPLSAALGKHDRVFPPLMVAMIRAGEAGGFLDGALERLATDFEKDAALRGKIRSALTYPAVVLAFTALLITAVLIFIVPVFERMFENLGAKLPLPTQIIVTASHSLVWLAPLLIAVGVTGTALMRRALRRDPVLRLRVDGWKLRMPVFGTLFTKIAVSRFARNLSALLGAGVPVMRALDIVAGTAGNAVVARAAQDIQDAVRDGLPMSAPLAGHPVFPTMVAQMMQVGEESGQIGAMLDKVADFYDREVDDAAESLTAAIEPVMVLLMGGGVGAMVICLYLPMFTVYQHIQGLE